MSAPVPHTPADRLDALRRRLTPRSYMGRAVLGTVAAMAIGLSFGGAARALKSSPPQPSLSITVHSQAAPNVPAPNAVKPNSATTSVAHTLAASAERSAVGVLARRFSLNTSDLAAEWRGTDVRYELTLQLRAARQSPTAGARLAGIVIGGLFALLVALLAPVAGVWALLRRRARRAAPETATAPVPTAPTGVRRTMPRPVLALRSRLASVRRRRPTPAAPVIALAAAGTNRAEIARRTGLSRDAIALALNVSQTA